MKAYVEVTMDDGRVIRFFLDEDAMLVLPGSQHTQEQAEVAASAVHLALGEYLGYECR